MSITVNPSSYLPLNPSRPMQDQPSKQQRLTIELMTNMDKQWPVSLLHSHTGALTHTPGALISSALNSAT